MVAVVSRDDFITDGDTPGAGWASKADRSFFAQLRSQHDLFVMGARTFDALPKNLSTGPVRVVLTKHPEKYSEQEMLGALQFKSLSPEKFVQDYRDTYASCLVLGGSQVYTDFLEAGLVDECYVVQEDQLLKKGTPLFTKNLKLEDFFQHKQATDLNGSSTQLIHYF